MALRSRPSIEDRVPDGAGRGVVRDDDLRRPCALRHASSTIRRQARAQARALALCAILAAADVASVGPSLMTAGLAQTRSAITMYSCKDASGRVISSDRPIPECANQPMRQMNGNGIVTREIAAPLTVDQQRRKAIADEAARVDSIRQRQNDARDRALLVTYASIDALETARSRQLADIRQEIGLARNRMISSHQDLKAAKASLAALPPNVSKEPALRNIRQIAASILADDAAVNRLQSEMGEVDKRFDDDRLRLRQLLREPDPMIQASRPSNPQR